jgi:hypothetical protein
MSQAIKNLSDLKKEKQKLLIQREASRLLFFKSLRATRDEALLLLTQKILLPVGIAGLASWGVSQFFSSNGEAGEEGEDESDTGPSLLQQLLPLGVELLSSYMHDQAERK